MKDILKLTSKNQVPGTPATDPLYIPDQNSMWASHLAVTLRGWDMWLGTAVMALMMLQPCKLLMWA